MASNSREVDDYLKHFVVEESSSDLDKEGVKLEAGSYGYVYEVSVGGVQRIAKKLHTIFTQEVRKKEKDRMVEKFKKECLILSKLRHPNVVQFVGVFYGKGGKDDIGLIMEKLDRDLAKFLEIYDNLELSTKLSILQDVSYGLVYLHECNPPIIHRDLAAHNILLTRKLQAKIADVGMAKLIDQAAEAARYTAVPGQQFYMPPEAKLRNPIYSYKLDIFSFGHLCLHTLLQKYLEAPEIPFSEAKKHEGFIEKQKRQEAFAQIGSNHVLYSIIVQCLRDDPDERPDTRQLNTAIISSREKESLVNLKEECERDKLQKKYLEAELEKARNTLKLQRKTYEDKISVRTNEVEELRRKIEEQALIIDQINNESNIKLTVMKSKFHKEKEQHKQTLKDLHRVTEDYQSSKLNLASKLARASAINKRLKDNVAVLSADKASIQKELKDLQEEMQAKLSKHESERISSEQNSCQLPEHIEQLQETVHTLQSEKAALLEEKNELASMQVEARKFHEKERQDLHNQLKAIDVVRKAKKNQYDEEKLRTDEASENYSRLSRELRTKDQVIIQHGQNVQILQEQLKSLKCKLEDLEEVNLKLKKENKQLLSKTVQRDEQTENYHGLYQGDMIIKQQQVAYMSALLDDYRELRQIAQKNGLQVPQQKAEGLYHYSLIQEQSKPYMVRPSVPKVHQQHPGSLQSRDTIKENELVQNIDDVTIEAAANMEERVVDTTLEPDDDARPLDSNFVCPHCGKQFQIGQIQHYRHHVRNCSNKLL